MDIGSTEITHLTHGHACVCLTHGLLSLARSLSLPFFLFADTFSLSGDPCSYRRPPPRCNELGYHRPRSFDETLAHPLRRLLPLALPPPPWPWRPALTCPAVSTVARAPKPPADLPTT